MVPLTPTDNKVTTKLPIKEYYYDLYALFNKKQRLSDEDFNYNGVTDSFE